jgi:two-component system, cell cycle sensor histidine kinase and response regulator CckA
MSIDAARLAALTTHGSDAVLLVRGSGDVEWANPATRDLLGADEAALVGEPVASLAEDTDGESWREFLSGLRTRPNAPLVATVRLRHEDGRPRWVEAVGQNLLEAPAVAALVIRLREISGVLDPEGPRPVSEEIRFRTLIEESRVAVLILQIDRVMYANPAAAEMTGYTVEELLALPSAFALIHEQDRGFVIDQLAELGRPGVRTLHLTVRGRRSDASLVQTEAIFAPTEFLGQAATLVTVFDIADRLRLEDQLRQTQKLEAVSRLAGGIAHDFNNLLATIRGNAELIAHQRASGASGAAEVDEILTAADRAATLTRQLLAFSRAQLMQPVVLDLNGVVLSVTRMVRRLLGADLRIEEDLEVGLALIAADPAHLEQVLLNLIINARDAMPSGGLVRVTTATESLTRGALAMVDTGLPPGPYVRLSVRDEGFGMDAATAARVFEPFFTTKEPGRGTGLGLSTVYGILRQLGGAVTLRTALGEGATFDLYFPVASGDSA